MYSVYQKSYAQRFTGIFPQQLRLRIFKRKLFIPVNIMPDYKILFNYMYVYIGHRIIFSISQRNIRYQPSYPLYYIMFAVCGSG